MGDGGGREPLWKVTERMVAELLQNDGWKLAHAPNLDRECGGGESAPMIRGKNGNRIMPDIYAMKSGRSVWVEVKLKKEGPEYIKKNQQYEHFIDRPNWHDYCEVTDESASEVWLVMYEKPEFVFIRQRIPEIDVVGQWTEAKVNEHNGRKYGNPGVFLRRSDFQVTHIGLQHAPRNFYGQDRITDLPEFDDSVLPDNSKVGGVDGGSAEDDGQTNLTAFAPGVSDP